MSPQECPYIAVYAYCTVAIPVAFMNYGLTGICMRDNSSKVRKERQISRPEIEHITNE